MGAVINKGDVMYLRSVYPELEVKEPTGQQEQLLLHFFRGAPASVAARNAGYTSFQGAKNYLKSESGQTILAYLKEREFEDVRIDRDTITGMFMEAYQMAATAGEKVAAARELGKLHGLYPDAKSAGNHIHITQNNIGDLTKKDLQRMSDAQLAEMAGPEIRALLTPASPSGGSFIEGTVAEEESPADGEGAPE